MAVLAYRSVSLLPESVMYEYKQRRLPLDEQSVLEGLWERLSQAQREHVLSHYSRWISAVLDHERAAGEGENSDVEKAQ